MIELPEAFVVRMKIQLGDEFDAFRESLSKPSPVSIRINPKKQAVIKRNDPVAWSQFGFYLKSRPVFTLDPAFHAGLYYVQEASSMFLEQVFTQTVKTQQITVLDLSAAPGGKTTHLLSLLDDESILVSNEVIRSRANILSENVIKWGYPNVIVTNNDPQDFQRLPGIFDVIVLDAPCSGEGLFRKDTEAITEWSEDNVALCASRQKRIIADVWPALKEDGILIYSTCTYNELENEENLKWIANNNDVEFLPVKLDPSWGVTEVRAKNIIGYKLLPHRVEGEGFFIAALRKKETTDTLRQRSKTKPGEVPTTFRNKLATWIDNADNFQFVRHEDLALIFPKLRMEIFEAARNNLRIVHAGTAVASIKHDKLVPEHALAMSIVLNAGTFPQVDLNDGQAIQFLRREPIDLPGLERGYHVITHNQIPLGFINSIGNRYNSLYPMEWRIRMGV